MIKCENCGAVVPEGSKFCLNCGSKIDSNAPKHFSLEEISKQQQAQENSAFSITPDTPDDDPDTYLPPIGAKEHSEIVPGEIDPQYFNHKPLPNIQAADPLELLECDTPDLPPIGFNDKMQVTDIPEGIRHYHGQEIVPVNLQVQTAFPVVRRGDVAGSLTRAQEMRHKLAEAVKTAKDDKPFSMLPDSLRVHFRHSGKVTASAVKAPETKKLSLDKKKKPKLSLQKAPAKESPTPVPETPKKISPEKAAPPPVLPDTYKVSLDKKEEKNPAPPAVETYTPPVISNPVQNNPQPMSFSPVQDNPQPTNFSSVQDNPQPMSFSPVQDNPQPTNFSSVQDNPQPMSFSPVQDYSQPMSFSQQEPQQQSGFMFSDLPGTPNPPDNSFNAPPMNYAMNAAMTRERNNQTAKMMLGIGIALIAVLIIAIIFMLGSGYYGFDAKSQRSYRNGSAIGTTIGADADRNVIKWSNLNNGGLASEDDEGNVFCTNSMGCIYKIDQNGKENIIYNGTQTNQFIMYIQYYEGKVYFLASVNGTSYSICSVEPDGKNFKKYTAKDEPAALFVHDGYLYYIDESARKLNRIRIADGAFEHIYTVGGDETVNSMFILGDKIYLHCIASEENACHVYTIDSGGSFSTGVLDFNYMGQTLIPLSLTYADNTLFIVDGSDNSFGQVYSADPDGSNLRLLGGSNIIKINAYGDNLYYFYMPGTLNETQDALLLGDLSGMIAFGVMKNDGSRQGELQGVNLLKYSYAAGRIYFVNFSKEVQSMLPDGTDIKTIS